MSISGIGGCDQLDDANASSGSGRRCEWHPARAGQCRRPEQFGQRSERNGQCRQGDPAPAAIHDAAGQSFGLSVGCDQNCSATTDAELAHVSSERAAPSAAVGRCHQRK